MKPLYIDHSIVTHEPGWPDLEALVASGKVCLVLSLWNLLEIALAEDSAQKERRIAFLEGLTPQWIRERREVQAQELHAFLWCSKYRRIPTEVSAIAPYLSMLVANWTGRKTVIGLTPRRWMADLDTDRMSSLKKLAPEALTILQEKGQAAVRRRQSEIFEKWITKLLPKQDPDGRYLSGEQKAELLAYCKAREDEILRECPALGVEHALTIARTQNPRRKPTKSDGPDLMHAAIALPYCDYFLVRDGFVRKCAESVLRQMPNVKLAAVHKDAAQLLAALRLRSSS